MKRSVALAAGLLALLVYESLKTVWGLGSRLGIRADSMPEEADPVLHLVRPRQAVPQYDFRASLVLVIDEQ